MFEIGRLVVKTSGREAGLKAAIIDIVDDKFVLIDGQTKRKKCNIQHLEPLNKKIKIKKNATKEEIKKEFEKLGIIIKEKKIKEKKIKPIKNVKTRTSTKKH